MISYLFEEEILKNICRKKRKIRFGGKSVEEKKHSSAGKAGDYAFDPV
jgi:hypothetical protein